MNDELGLLSNASVSLWLEDLNRHRLVTGSLADMVARFHVVGVTTNPTIFAKAITGADNYSEQLGELSARGVHAGEALRALTTFDVRWACDVLRPVYDATDGVDGRVSIKVDPRLAYDTEGTYEEARRLHELIDKPNLYVKIPGTKPGLPAIEDMIAAGKSINITLLFSQQRHREVMEAYLRGLERLVASGGDPRKVSSVASFFVSRVDTEADKRLEAIGSDAARALRGKLAVANARLAYQNWEEAFAGERWQFLASKGASKQWCLWASTSTKNPDYPDTLYVDTLIGPESINTMPLETIEAFQDHGTVALAVEEHLDEADSLFRELERIGVDVEDVTETLEEEGVQKFDDSLQELFDGIRAKRGELVTA